MSTINDNTYEPGFINDVGSLNDLRQGAQKHDGAALHAAARQFESIFTQMMFKSMRDANQEFKSDLFENRNASFFEEMRDQQMTSELSSRGSLGLADMIVQQTNAMNDNEPKSKVDVTQLHREQKALPLYPEKQTQLIRPEQPVKMDDDIEFMALLKSIKKHRQGDEPVIGVSSATVIAADRDKKVEAFVRKMEPYARKTAEKLGVDPEVLIAQAALETGWGKSVISNDGQSSYNLFNIKADKRWNGDKMNTLTREVYHGVSVKERANFRAYDSYQQSFDDYVQFLRTNPRYKTALASPDSTTYVTELHKAGYATDPNYSSKILEISKRVKAMME